MGTRINLAPNPALRNNATGWFGPSGGGWTRAGNNVADSFNRPDSATVLGPADTGQGWEPQGGSTWGISALKAYTTSATSVTALIESSLNNVEATAKITFGAGGSLPGLVFRAIDDSNRLGVFLDIAAGGLQLWKTDAGVQTNIASGPVTLTAGVEYTVRVVANGTSITGYVNGTQIFTHTLAGGDATKYVGAGYSKVGFRGSSHSRFDDLAAAPIGSGVDLSLPRPTAFVGTAPDHVVSPKFTAVANAQYVASVSVRAVVAHTATISVDWYDTADAFLSGSAVTNWSAGAGTTVRPEIGPLTAPALAARGLVTLKGMSGSAQVTALLVERTSTLGGAYFDGDTAGATWAGTAGNSTSYLLTGDDAIALADSGSMVATTPGPVGGDAMALAESAGVVGSGVVTDEFALVDSGLILELAYDDTRGRLRINAFGLPATAIRAKVLSRPVSAGRFAPVRGGEVTVTDGRFLKRVDDYEFTAGAAMVYKIIALSSADTQPDVIVAEATVTRAADPLARVWLKFIPGPHLNRRITLTGWGDITRPSRNSIYDVVGRSEPVVVTDVHGSRRVTITARTSTLEEAAALDEALRQGAPIFLHTPVTLALPSMYAVVGDVSYDRPTARSHTARWTIPLVEVAAPPPSVVPAGVTYQTVLDTYLTYQELHDVFATYQEVLS